jgi:hypothetical protein
MCNVLQIATEFSLQSSVCQSLLTLATHRMVIVYVDYQADQGASKCKAWCREGVAARGAGFRSAWLGLDSAPSRSRGEANVGGFLRNKPTKSLRFTNGVEVFWQMNPRGTRNTGAEVPAVGCARLGNTPSLPGPAGRKGWLRCGKDSLRSEAVAAGLPVGLSYRRGWKGAV